MEKRQLLLIGMLLLFFGMGYHNPLKGQCVASVVCDNGLGIGPGGIQIVDSGEGEGSEGLGGPGIYFDINGCTATLYITFRLANLVPHGNGFKLPSETDPIQVYVDINNTITEINIQDGEYDICTDGSGSLYFWSGAVIYDLTDACGWVNPHLDATVEFRKQSDNSLYDLCQYSDENGIFTTDEFCETYERCGPFGWLNISVQLSEDDFCTNCEGPGGGGMTHEESDNAITVIPELSQSLQPNPFNTNPVLIIKGEPEAEFVAMIVDAQGRTIHTIKDRLSANGNYRKKVNTSLWAPGVYFSKLQQGTNFSTVRMIKLD